ncbi:hypothetical protein [Streptomyces sp. GC420]|uniref:hypothetical protein n=1 Tax=Streptomyces sp. GC420 TaxID=2697568 RepID=UPI001414DC68|nr:hypothetical protein [Streptomyces sp. GC420]NBM17053.1 hypothetical protein [Streptomyces sp. GC420]
MRVRRVPAITAAALGLVLLSGCRDDNLNALPTDSPAATVGAESPEADTGNTADPAETETPADTSQARRVVNAPVAAGMDRADGAASDVSIDPGEMRDGMNLVMDYYDMNPGILVVAVDNVPEDTSERREHLWRGMLDHIAWDYELGQPEAQPVADPGPLGGSVECMLASLDAEAGDVICGWADENTVGVAHFPDSALEQAGELFVKMRSDLEK